MFSLHAGGRFGAITATGGGEWKRMSRRLVRGSGDRRLWMGVQGVLRPAISRPPSVNGTMVEPFPAFQRNIQMELIAPRA